MYVASGLYLCDRSDRVLLQTSERDSVEMFCSSRGTADQRQTEFDLGYIALPPLDWMTPPVTLPSRISVWVNRVNDLNALSGMGGGMDEPLAAASMANGIIVRPPASSSSSEALVAANATIARLTAALEKAKQRDDDSDGSAGDSTALDAARAKSETTTAALEKANQNDDDSYLGACSFYYEL